MYRQQYQDKYIINNNSEIRKRIKIKEEIEAIEEELKDVFYLFEELKNENIKQSSSFTHISDIIENSKNEISESENQVNQSKEEQDKYSYISSVTGGLIGAGLGSLVFIYSPYIAIGTTIGGFIGGYSLPFLKIKN